MNLFSAYRIGPCPALSAVVLGFALAAPAGGAITVFDGFSDGAFVLDTRGGQRDTTNPITSDVVAQRLAGGNGPEEWSASVDAGTGLFTYTVDLRGAEPTPLSSFLLSYTRPGDSFSLLGYDAFVLTVVDVVGAGRLHVIFGGISGDGAPLVIDGPGEYVYPFSDVGAGPPLDQLTHASFWFFPETTDFSVTIDEIAVVPEPGAVPLAAIGVAMTFLRRRRSHRRPAE